MLSFSADIVIRDHNNYWYITFDRIVSGELVSHQPLNTFLPRPENFTFFPRVFLGGNSNLPILGYIFLSWLWIWWNWLNRLYTFHSSSLILTYIWKHYEKLGFILRNEFNIQSSQYKTDYPRIWYDYMLD